MTRDDLMVFHDDMCRRAYWLMVKKNKDYTGKSKDALANFMKVEEFGIPAAQGVITRMADKFSRLATLVTRPPAVEDESIHDTILDIINYAVLLEAVLQETARLETERKQDNENEDDIAVGRLHGGREHANWTQLDRPNGVAGDSP